MIEFLIEYEHTSSHCICEAMTWIAQTAANVLLCSVTEWMPCMEDLAACVEPVMSRSSPVRLKSDSLSVELQQF